MEATSQSLNSTRFYKGITIPTTLRLSPGFGVVDKTQLDWAIKALPGACVEMIIRPAP
jgi:hypothetical protein